MSDQPQRSELSTKHAAEVERANRWHRLDRAMAAYCNGRCKGVTAHTRSRWQVGVIRCDGCGWKGTEYFR
jgi:hypothetical protein